MGPSGDSGRRRSDQELPSTQLKVTKINVCTRICTKDQELHGRGVQVNTARAGRDLHFFASICYSQTVSTSSMEPASALVEHIGGLLRLLIGVKEDAILAFAKAVDLSSSPASSGSTEDRDSLDSGSKAALISFANGSASPVSLLIAHGGAGGDAGLRAFIDPPASLLAGQTPLLALVKNANAPLSPSVPLSRQLRALPLAILDPAGEDTALVSPSLADSVQGLMKQVLMPVLQAASGAREAKAFSQSGQGSLIPEDNQQEGRRVDAASGSGRYGAQTRAAWNSVQTSFSAFAASLTSLARTGEIPVVTFAPEPELAPLIPSRSSGSASFSPATDSAIAAVLKKAGDDGSVPPLAARLKACLESWSSALSALTAAAQQRLGTEKEEIARGEEPGEETAKLPTGDPARQQLQQLADRLDGWLAISAALRSANEEVNERKEGAVETTLRAVTLLGDARSPARFRIVARSIDQPGVSVDLTAGNASSVLREAGLSLLVLADRRGEIAKQLREPLKKLASLLPQQHLADAEIDDFGVVAALPSSLSSFVGVIGEISAKITTVILKPAEATLAAVSASAAGNRGMSSLAASGSSASVSPFPSDAGLAAFAARCVDDLSRAVFAAAIPCLRLRGFLGRNHGVAFPHSGVLEALAIAQQEVETKGNVAKGLLADLARSASPASSSAFPASLLTVTRRIADLHSRLSEAFAALSSHRSLETYMDALAAEEGCSVDNALPLLDVEHTSAEGFDNAASARRKGKSSLLSGVLTGRSASRKAKLAGSLKELRASWLELVTDAAAGNLLLDTSVTASGNWKALVDRYQSRLERCEGLLASLASEALAEATAQAAEVASKAKLAAVSVEGAKESSSGEAADLSSASSTENDSFADLVRVRAALPVFAKLLVAPSSSHSSLPDNTSGTTAPIAASAGNGASLSISSRPRIRAALYPYQVALLKDILAATEAVHSRVSRQGFLSSSNGDFAVSLRGSGSATLSPVAALVSWRLRSVKEVAAYVGLAGLIAGVGSSQGVARQANISSVESPDALFRAISSLAKDVRDKCESSVVVRSWASAVWGGISGSTSATASSTVLSRAVSSEYTLGRCLFLAVRGAVNRSELAALTKSSQALRDSLSVLTSSAVSREVLDDLAPRSLLVSAGEVSRHFASRLFPRHLVAHPEGGLGAALAAVSQLLHLPGGFFVYSLGVDLSQKLPELVSEFRALAAMSQQASTVLRATSASSAIIPLNSVTEAAALSAASAGAASAVDQQLAFLLPPDAMPSEVRLHLRTLASKVEDKIHAARRLAFSLGALTAVEGSLATDIARDSLAKPILEAAFTARQLESLVPLRLSPGSAASTPVVPPSSATPAPSPSPLLSALCARLLLAVVGPARRQVQQAMQEAFPTGAGTGLSLSLHWENAALLQPFANRLHASVSHFSAAVGKLKQSLGQLADVLTSSSTSSASATQLRSKLAGIFLELAEHRQPVLPSSLRVSDSTTITLRSFSRFGLAALADLISLMFAAVAKAAACHRVLSWRDSLGTQALPLWGPLPPQQPRQQTTVRLSHSILTGTLTVEPSVVSLRRSLSSELETLLSEATASITLPVFEPPRRQVQVNKSESSTSRVTGYQASLGLLSERIVSLLAGHLADSGGRPSLLVTPKVSLLLDAACQSALTAIECIPRSLSSSIALYSTAARAMTAPGAIALTVPRKSVFIAALQAVLMRQGFSRTALIQKMSIDEEASDAALDVMASLPSKLGLFVCSAATMKVTGALAVAASSSGLPVCINGAVALSPMPSARHVLTALSSARHLSELCTDLARAPVRQTLSEDSDDLGGRTGPFVRDASQAGFSLFLQAHRNATSFLSSLDLLAAFIAAQLAFRAELSVSAMRENASALAAFATETPGHSMPASSAVKSAIEAVSRLSVLAASLASGGIGALPESVASRLTLLEPLVAASGGADQAADKRHVRSFGKPGESKGTPGRGPKLHPLDAPIDWVDTAALLSILVEQCRSLRRQLSASRQEAVAKYGASSSAEGLAEADARAATRTLQPLSPFTLSERRPGSGSYGSSLAPRSALLHASASLLASSLLLSATRRPGAHRVRTPAHGSPSSRGFSLPRVEDSGSFSASGPAVLIPLEFLAAPCLLTEHLMSPHCYAGLTVSNEQESASEDTFHLLAGLSASSSAGGPSVAGVKDTSDASHAAERSTAALSRSVNLLLQLLKGRKTEVVLAFPSLCDAVLSLAARTSGAIVECSGKLQLVRPQGTSAGENTSGVGTREALQVCATLLQAASAASEDASAVADAQKALLGFSLVLQEVGVPISSGGGSSDSGSIPDEASSNGSLATSAKPLNAAQKARIAASFARLANGLNPSSLRGQAEALLDDINTVASIWRELEAVSSQIQSLASTAFYRVDGRTLRSALDGLADVLRGVPVATQQSLAFEALTLKVKSWKDSLPLVNELRSPSTVAVLKRRHVEGLWRALGISSPKREGTASGPDTSAQDAAAVSEDSKQDCYSAFPDVTLGDVLAADLRRHERTLREIVRSAVGEGAVQSFLDGVSSHWEDQSLWELVPHRGGRCLVVKGWENVLTACDDHLSSLASLKLSPFYSPFEATALAWEARIQSLRSVIETWMDVQRRWLYLDGLLSSQSPVASDIRAQLPQEAARFSQADGDLASISRKVAENPQVMAVLTLHVAGSAGFDSQNETGLDANRLSAAQLLSLPSGNVSQRLSAVLENLERVHKGLSEYLHRTRSAFPRLFFLGDDDCLELLGSAPALCRDADASGISRHLQTMFAGVTGLVLEKAHGSAVDRETPSSAGEGANTTALCSRVLALLSAEGEALELVQPVEIRPKTKLTTVLRRVTQSMRVSLAAHTHSAAKALLATSTGSSDFADVIVGLFKRQHDKLPGEKTAEGIVPSEAVLLAMWAVWTSQAEEAILKSKSASPSASLLSLAAECDGLLSRLSKALQSGAQSSSWASFAKKTEHAITEILHRRDVTKGLATVSSVTKTAADDVTLSLSSYSWTSKLRLYLSNGPINSKAEASPSDQAESEEESASGDDASDLSTVSLSVRQALASFTHGCEWRGIGERLVQTPLTDRAYLALTQALALRLGGSPFGPAGTGKTETVKALGGALGRLVLVFNCDESFEHGSMGRILSGLVQSGAWACFDEFNRLTERVLSAISSQILAIQGALATGSRVVDLGSAGGAAHAALSSTSGSQSATLLPCHPNVGLFVTMNPGYAGRSALPDNLKALFRPVAMVAPDAALIAEVLLITRGFSSAAELARRINRLFELCREQLSSQSQYDWGLRSLKSLLTTAGTMLASSATSGADAAGQRSFAAELGVLCQAANDSIMPKLVPDDARVYKESFLPAVFAEVGETGAGEQDALLAAVAFLSELSNLQLAAGTTALSAKNVLSEVAWPLVSYDSPQAMALAASNFGSAGVLPLHSASLLSGGGTLLANGGRLSLGSTDASTLLSLAAALRAGAAGTLLPSDWLTKILQLHATARVRHGIMTVGPSGSGKSAALRCLTEALTLVDGIKNEVHVLDPKASPSPNAHKSFKEQLYGTLDQATLEWRDGLLTSLIRSIATSQAAATNLQSDSTASLTALELEWSRARHWIVFEGEIDPDWAESLNSVLDDNKLLTLPSGERIPLPPNLRFVFEVDSLANATLATVSRCGMVCFSEETVTAAMILRQYSRTLVGGASAYTASHNSAHGQSSVGAGPAGVNDALALINKANIALTTGDSCLSGVAAKLIAASSRKTEVLPDRSTDSSPLKAQHSKQKKLDDEASPYTFPALLGDVVGCLFDGADGEAFASLVRAGVGVVLERAGATLPQQPLTAFESRVAEAAKASLKSSLTDSKTGRTGSLSPIMPLNAASLSISFLHLLSSGLGAQGLLGQLASILGPADKTSATRASQHQQYKQLLDIFLASKAQARPFVAVLAARARAYSLVALVWALSAAFPASQRPSIALAIQAGALSLASDPFVEALRLALPNGQASGSLFDVDPVGLLVSGAVLSAASPSASAAPQHAIKTWLSQVPTVETAPGDVLNTSLVIPTVDTVRHSRQLGMWMGASYSNAAPSMNEGIACSIAAATYLPTPLLLCGPPGAGKTLVLTSVLNSKLLAGYSEVNAAFLSFSSATGPDAILQALEQHCEYVKLAGDRYLLQPRSLSGSSKVSVAEASETSVLGRGGPHPPGPLLVLFCDEINLPAADKYGAVHSVSYLRSLITRGGFWMPSRKTVGRSSSASSSSANAQPPPGNTWVSVRGVQIVGACNPPTDPGRIPLAARFLRHCPVLLVDYPSSQALQSIYGTLMKGLCKIHPSLRGLDQAFTNACIEAFSMNAARFAPLSHRYPQYVYSPRELSRWLRALFEAIQPQAAALLSGNGSLSGSSSAQSSLGLHPSLLSLSGPYMCRLWLHEGLRLFADRCATEEDRKWVEDTLEKVARKNFAGAIPGLSAGGDAPNGAASLLDAVVARPVVFSDWTSRFYLPSHLPSLRTYITSRAKIFSEEVMGVVPNAAGGAGSSSCPIVVFDEALAHMARIDRVLRQPLGHLLLIGASGAGKSLLTRFTAWLRGMPVFTVKISHRYGLEHFDNDLRTVMRRAGVDGEKVVFLFDESNVLSSAFLERMNALLASGEVPGLWDSAPLSSTGTGAASGAAGRRGASGGAEDLHAALLADCRAAWGEASAGQGTSASSGIPVAGSAVSVPPDPDLLSVDLDNDDAVFSHFTRRVQRNLHVVFTLNPATSAFAQRRATSPALFNRCVVDWFGEWSPEACAQIAASLTSTLDLSFKPLQARPGGAVTFLPPPSLGLVIGDPSVVATETPLTLTSHARRTRDIILLAASARERERETSSSRAASKPVGAASIPAIEYRDAVVAALVLAHFSSAQLLQDSSSPSSSIRAVTPAVSPRDFLDLMHQYLALYTSRRAQLEARQLHLSSGLDRIRATEDQVAKLQASLAEKRQLLASKNAAAEAKLIDMLRDQKEAEERKAASLSLSQQLDAQNKEIDSRSLAVSSELADAEPALRDAQTSVQSIKRTQLDEVRALGTPPAPVKLALEAVLVVLGHDPSTLDWAEIRRVLRASDFIQTVCGFKSESFSSKARSLVAERYMRGPQSANFTFERISGASHACGPLYKWVVSQVRYAEILEKVEPLRNELQTLKQQSSALTAQVQSVNATLVTLEASISALKGEYASLIREAEAVKQEMAAVEQKVSRATALVSSLAAERVRWEKGSKGFDAQLQTLASDCVVGAAFCSYAGGFDFAGRKALEEEWEEILDALGIPRQSTRALLSLASAEPDGDDAGNEPVKDDSSFAVSFLVTPSERLRWQACGLGSDEISIGNAVLLSRFRRFPFIVDSTSKILDVLPGLLAPSSQAIAGTGSLAPRALSLGRASLLDGAYLKSLESAARFGNSLLLTDAEAGDPVLNPILNRETFSSSSAGGGNSSGRVMVRIGENEVDLSPSFAMFLFTKDPQPTLSADLASRVTLVNFSLSAASLSASLLSQLLEAEAPSVSARRRATLALRAEAGDRLRALEEKLLEEIAGSGSSTSSILDDDRVLNSLEVLKAKALAFEQQLSSATSVLRRFQSASRVYACVSDAVASCHVALAALPSTVHPLYCHDMRQFSEALQRGLALHSAAELSATGLPANAPTSLDAKVEDDESVIASSLSALSPDRAQRLCIRLLRALLYPQTTSLSAGMYEHDALVWALSVACIASSASLKLIRTAVEVNSEARGGDSGHVLGSGTVSPSYLLDTLLLRLIIDGSTSTNRSLPSDSDASVASPLLGLTNRQSKNLERALGISGQLLGDGPNNWLSEAFSLGCSDQCSTELKGFAEGSTDVCPLPSLAQDSVARAIACAFSGNGKKAPTATALLAINRALAAFSLGSTQYLSNSIGAIRRAVLAAILRPETLHAHASLFVDALLGESAMAAVSAEEPQQHEGLSSSSSSSAEALARLIVTSALSSSSASDVVSILNGPVLSPLLLLCTPGADPEKVVSSACNLAIEQSDVLGEHILAEWTSRRPQEPLSGAERAGLLGEVVETCLPVSGLRAVSLGTAQSASAAEAALAAGLRSGLWVLLRNAHLDTHWLENTLKRLQSSRSAGTGGGASSNGLSGFHPAFRLILTAEVPHYSTLEAIAAAAGASSAVQRAAARLAPLPPSILRMSTKIVLEAPQDFGASASRLLLLLEPNRWSASTSSAPDGATLLPRLYLLLAWLHAAILQKNRYVPLGTLGSGSWTKAYEFSDGDFLSAVSMAEALMTASHPGGPSGVIRSLRKLVCDSIYGARLESLQDVASLNSLASLALHEAALGEGHPLTFPADKHLTLGPSQAREGGVLTPDASVRTRDAIVRWVEGSTKEAFTQLSLTAPPPSWFGVPDSSESRLQERQGILSLGSAFCLTDVALGKRDPPLKKEVVGSGSSGNASASASGSAQGSSSFEDVLSAQEVAICRDWVQTATSSLPPAIAVRGGDSEPLTFPKPDGTYFDLRPIAHLYSREAQVVNRLRDAVAASIEEVRLLVSNKISTGKKDPADPSAAANARALCCTESRGELPTGSVWRKAAAHLAVSSLLIDPSAVLAALSSRARRLGAILDGLMARAHSEASLLLDLSCLPLPALLQLQSAIQPLLQEGRPLRLSRALDATTSSTGDAIILSGVELCGASVTGDKISPSSGLNGEEVMLSFSLQPRESQSDEDSFSVPLFGPKRADRGVGNPTFVSELTISASCVIGGAETNADYLLEAWRARGVALKTAGV